MSIYNILQELSETTKSTIKINILKEHIDNELLKRVFVAALSPINIYYIKKIPDYTPSENPTLTLDDALSKLVDFSSRKYTGNAAIQHLTNILNALSESDADIISRIIQGNLKCGVNESTINKVFKDLIPEYPYQRCSQLKSAKAAKYPWDKGVYSQLKADGLYANLNYSNVGEIRILTRAGREFESHDQFANIIDYVKNNFYKNTQTHGEFLVEKDGKILPREIGNGILNKVSKGGKFEENEKPIYMVWDQIPLDNAVPKGRYEKTYDFRYSELISQIKTSKADIQLIKSKLVYSLEEALADFQYWLSLGYEGSVIKNPDGFWRDGTSTDQIKLKLIVEVDLEIVGYTTGTGKNKEMFGSIMTKTSDDLLEVNIPGIKDAMRKYIHEHADELIGTIVVVKFNNILPPTDNNTKYSLFLPRFVELRSDKLIADSLEQVIDQYDSAINSMKYLD